MSLDLIDARIKITHEADAVLEALSRTTGRDRSEIAREALDAWAKSKIHEANVLASMLSTKGLTGIAGGISGSLRESEGFAGSRGDSEGSLGKRRA